MAGKGESAPEDKLAIEDDAVTSLTTKPVIISQYL